MGLPFLTAMDLSTVVYLDDMVSMTAVVPEWLHGILIWYLE